MVDKVLFDIEQKILLCYPFGKTDMVYKIPGTVTTISAFALQNQNIKMIILPDSVCSVGEYAFAYCTKLNKILYTGTQSEYETINIMSGNNISNKVYFQFDEKKPVCVGEIEKFFDNEQSLLNIKIGFDYVVSDGEAVVALYDDSERLITTFTKSFFTDDSEIELYIPFEDFNADNKIKVFFWNNIAEMIPLSKSETSS